MGVRGGGGEGGKNKRRGVVGEGTGMDNYIYIKVLST